MARAKKLGGRLTARKRPISSTNTQWWGMNTPPPLSIVSLYTVSNISILHFLIVDNYAGFAQWLFNDKREDTIWYLLFCRLG
ncbi:hypothetical protein AAHB49_03105 [Bacillus cereus]